jgi:hypothetical protein
MIAQPVITHSGEPAQIEGVPVRYSVILWLAAGGLALILCLYCFSGTLVDGEFLPADNDSFYHARRIIDAIPHPLQMYQFDPRIHVPEGLWITWPWAYDMMMAFIGKVLMTITGATNPMSVLAFVAPAWVFLNAALLLGVASRLGLSFPLQVITMLCFALSSLTRNLHRVGMIDHHFIEYTFVLATLYAGLRWFQDISDRRRAVLLGFILGMAPAFHQGLFILQLPVLITLACLWWLGRPIPRRAVSALVLILITTTAVFLLPSEQFRSGVFEYYFYSWFHLYIAACTGVICMLVATWRRNIWTVSLLLLVGLLLSTPIIVQIMLGADFILSRVAAYQQIAEMRNIMDSVRGGELAFVNQFYSYLVWLLPLGVGGVCWRLRHDSSNHNLFFAVMTLFGVFLLLQQFRLEYFGSFALYLPLCILAMDAGRRWIPAKTWGAMALGIMAAIAQVPGLAKIRDAYPLASDFRYSLTRAIYYDLHEACQRRPGVVLADSNEGHFITYHSDCSVIADNFILTKQELDKNTENERLLRSTLTELLIKAPYVRYIFVHRSDNLAANGSSKCFPDCPEIKGLRQELLLENPSLPPEVKLLRDIQVQRDAVAVPYARLFEVVRSEQR